MGGDQAAAAKLAAYFTQLNATRDAPYDWSGNEPGEWAPWAFDYFGAPAQTQRVVRAIADTEYADAPVDEPGNDDLGAISSWYVWAALGLFPVTPGTADLALASPLFPNTSVLLPDGHRLVLHAPGAAASRPYIHALTASGIARPLIGTPGCTPDVLVALGRRQLGPSLAAVVGPPERRHPRLLALGDRPTRRGAPRPADAPPSYGAGQLPAVGLRLSERRRFGRFGPVHVRRARRRLRRMSARRRSRGTRRRGPAGHRSPLRRALSSSSHRAGPRPPRAPARSPPPWPSPSQPGPQATTRCSSRCAPVSA